MNRLCGRTAVASGEARLATFGDGVDGFQLRNLGSDSFEFNPAGWALHEWMDAGWEHVAPVAQFGPLQTLAAGDRYRWYLGEAPNDDLRSNLDVDIDIGQFAFSILEESENAERTYTVLFDRE